MNDGQGLEPPRGDDLGELLTVELHRRADGLHGSLGFDEVRDRAASIRRRRAAASLVGVAAAVAVIVPTALVAARSDRSPEPLPATVLPTSSVSHTSAPPTADAHPHRLDVSGLPTGALPSLSLVSDADTTGLFAFTQVGGTTIRVSDAGVVVTEADGSTYGPYGSESSVVRNEQGTIAAWVTLDGQVMAWQDGEAEPLVLGTVDLAGPRVAAVTGFDCRPGGRCSVWLSGSDPASYEPVSVRVDQDGTVSPVDGSSADLLVVRDVTEGQVMRGTTRLDIDGSCSALVNAPGSSEAPRFQTCRHQLDAFSASGRYVLASEPYHSGIGSGEIAIYDAQTGKPTASRISDRPGLAFYTTATWEDDTHALFTAYQDGQWSVVRIGVNGSMEYAVAPVAGDDTANPFVLETR